LLAQRQEPRRLRRADRLLRRAEAVAAPGLHLDQHQHVTVEGNEVDLASFSAPLPVEDAPAACGQDPLGVPLSGVAQAAASHGRAPGSWAARRSRTGANVRRWCGVGPTRSSASRCSAVPYPALRSQPYSGWRRASRAMSASRVTLARMEAQA